MKGSSSLRRRLLQSTLAAALIMSGFLAPVAMTTLPATAQSQTPTSGKLAVVGASDASLRAEPAGDVVATLTMGICPYRHRPYGRQPVDTNRYATG